MGASTSQLTHTFTHKPQAKADKHAVKEQVLATARTFFRPEMLNRLDDIVVFDPLSDVSGCVLLVSLCLFI